jgi:hypothetical protein
MDNTEWLLLDTETNGIKVPVYVVELAAQWMRGWLPHGEPIVAASTMVPCSSFVTSAFGRGCVKTQIPKIRMVNCYQFV